jgi:hypothetical protein
MRSKLTVLREQATNEPFDVLTADELHERLDALHAAEAGEVAPAMATLELASGDALTIGLGRDETVLSFTPASGDPPYFASRGGGAADEPVLVFFVEGHWTEFSRRNAVSWAAGRQAMLDFMETGDLSNVIAWEEV